MATSKQRLLAQLNAENPQPNKFTEANIIFGVPQADMGPSWDTKVTLTAVSGSGYIGSVDVRYNRIELDQMNYTDLISEPAFTVQSFLDQLNEDRQVWLEADDLDNFSIPAMQTGVVTDILLKAKPTSLGWNASHVVQAVIGIPSKIGLLHQTLHTTMPAPNYL